MPEMAHLNQSKGSECYIMFEISVNADGVIIVKIKYLDSLSEVLEINKSVYELELKNKTDKRIVDVRDIQNTKLNFESMFQFEKIRTEQKPKGKTAYIYNTSIGLGFARMWQQLIETPEFSIGIFETEPEAYEWLK